ncbi:MAG: cyclase/dehydrase, partial [Chloroflexi bacterium]
KLFGEEPNQQISEDLRRFKRLMEAGEIPTTAGQPRGSRSMLGKLLSPSS